MTNNRITTISSDRDSTKLGCRRATAVALAFLLPLVAAGCGSVSMPIGSSDLESPLDLTGSIDSQQNAADVDISSQDRAIIARAIATAHESGMVEPPFSWNNPITGNSGTIVAVKDDTQSGGTGCTRFETTANTIGGVRAYLGTACRDLMQEWAIIDLSVKAAEAETAS